MPRPCNHKERTAVILLTASSIFFGDADADARLTTTFTIYDACAIPLPSSRSEVIRILDHGMPHSDRPFKAASITVSDVSSLTIDRGLL